MPSLEEHNARDRADRRGDHTDVHVLLDQFAHYPDMRFLRGHRKFLHHQEGIEYIRLRFGDEAAAAARQHVIDDTGHVPSMADYALGKVDNFGRQGRGL